MAVRGIFASHSNIVGDRQPDLAGRVLMTMPSGMAPMLALSSGMPRDSAGDTAFSWIEDAWINGNSAIATGGGGNASATELTVEDANIWTPNTILMNQDTGEHMFITGIAGNTITVIRGLSGTSAEAVDNGHVLQSIGTGFAEATGRPEAVAQRGHTRTNYVQIFKNGWAISGTAQHVNFLTGSQMAMNREQCFSYHAEDIERAFLWGRKTVTVMGGKQFRLSDGIIPQIEAYGGLVESAAYLNEAGEMSLFGLQNFMRRIFDIRVKGMPNERIAFCGSELLEKIQQMMFMDGVYNFEKRETEWGIQVTTLNIFNGKLSLVTHPMMVDNPYWQKELYVLHPGLIRRRVLRDSWTEEFSTKKQNNNGLDATEGYIAIEMGFEVKGANTMGVMTNIETPVPSIQSDD